MERRRNLLPLAGLAVCVVAFLSYFIVFSQFPLTRDVPWTGWVLLALGLGLAVAGILRPYRQPGRYRGKMMGPLLAALSLVVAGLFVYTTAVMSRQIPAAAGAPQVGQKAPDFVLQDPQGRPVRLYDLLGSPRGAGQASWVVLVFYRGYW